MDSFSLNYDFTFYNLVVESNNFAFLIPSLKRGFSYQIVKNDSLFHEVIPFAFKHGLVIS